MRQAAKSALDAAIDGFEQGRDKPGPGLWRAIRGMMDFRQATVLDVPSANFKKQHRAGRQVRDYRFWEAAKVHRIESSFILVEFYTIFKISEL